MQDAPQLDSEPRERSRPAYLATDDTTPRLPPPLSVLVASGDEWSARAIESILSAEGYAVLRAGTAREALIVAQRRVIDALIAESTLPDQSAVELCRALRADPAFGARVPVLITMAGPVERTARLHAHEAGAWQVYGQPLDVPLLVRQLEAYLGGRPPLRREPLAGGGAAVATAGLLPADAFVQLAAELAAEAARRRSPLAAVALGAGLVITRPDAPVSTCAAVPDTEVLLALGARLCVWRRSNDVVGRLGEVEFGLLAPATGLDGARHLVRRLAHAVEAASWPIGARYRLVLRAGISAVTDFTVAGPIAERLLDDATLALRRSAPAAAAVGTP